MYSAQQDAAEEQMSQSYLEVAEVLTSYCVCWRVGRMSQSYLEVAEVLTRETSPKLFEVESRNPT